jgi:hypothetical protein
VVRLVGDDSSRIRYPLASLRHLAGALVTLLLISACKTTPAIDETLHARGRTAFSGEAFIMLEVQSHGAERDRAFIETARSGTAGPSGLAEQLAALLTAVAESESKSPIVIGGGSSAKTKQVVLDGVELVTRSLAGQRVLFVGAREDEPEVRAAIEGRGGQLLFAEYGDPDRTSPAYPIHFAFMDVPSGGSMRTADGTVALFLEIENTSTSRLWIVTTLELAGGSPGGEVEKALAPGERQVFEHPQTSMQEGSDYWITAKACGDPARSKERENHRLHFRFSSPR